MWWFSWYIDTVFLSYSPLRLIIKSPLTYIHSTTHDMPRELPSKNIVPNASSDPDINSYTYQSNPYIIPVDKAKFIRLCENASVFPEGSYQVYSYPSDGSQSSARGCGSPPCPRNHRPEVFGSSDMGISW